MNCHSVQYFGVGDGFVLCVDTGLRAPAVAWHAAPKLHLIHSDTAVQQVSSCRQSLSPLCSLELCKLVLAIEPATCARMHRAQCVTDSST